MLLFLGALKIRLVEAWAPEWLPQEARAGVGGPGLCPERSPHHPRAGPGTASCQGPGPRPHKRNWKLSLEENFTFPGSTSLPWRLVLDLNLPNGNCGLFLQTR